MQIPNICKECKKNSWGKRKLQIVKAIANEENVILEHTCEKRE